MARGRPPFRKLLTRGTPRCCRAERGATRDEVVATVESGERFSAKFGRSGFRRNFSFDDTWRGRFYGTKQVEAYAVEEEEGWLVITVIVKYF